MRKHLTVFVVLAIMLAHLAGCAAAVQPPNGSEAVPTSAGMEQGRVPETSSHASGGSANVEVSDASSHASGENGSVLADIGADFPSWNADASSLKALLAYVEAATEEGGADYVPPEDRIAVFDMDGTILCEKAPVYMDYMLLLHRVQDDPSFVPTGEMRALCDEIRSSANEGIVLSDADRPYKKNDALAQSFAGMTFDEFRAYVSDFMATKEVEGFTGMTYGTSFYKPMLEVVSYLQARDFDVYVVTASEREVARAAVEPLGIDAAHVIGSDWAYTATNQGAEEGVDYTYEQSDDLIIAGYYLGETGKTNKVIAIQREIGKHPVLAFGNSSGDFAMLNYALDNDEHPAVSFLVLADDEEREYGNAEKAAEMRGSAEGAGWTAISMREDWATIYGDDVAKTQLRADDGQAAAKAA